MILAIIIYTLAIIVIAYKLRNWTPPASYQDTSDYKEKPFWFDLLFEGLFKRFDAGK